MVAIADGVADVGRDYVSGFRRSVEFQTEAEADITAYRTELGSMSEVGSLAHLAGAVCGGIVDIVTLGHFERKSFRKLTYGKSDVSYSGGDVMDFVKRYEVAHGVDSGDVGSNLEGSVGSSDVRANRRKVNDVAEEGNVEKDEAVRGYELGEDEVEVFIDDDGNVYDIENGNIVDRRVRDADKAYGMAVKENVGRVKMYEARKRRAGNSNLEKSVKSVVGAEIEAGIERAYENIKAGKSVVDEVVKNVNKAIAEYEAKTGKSLNEGVDKRYGFDRADDEAYGWAKIFEARDNGNAENERERIARLEAKRLDKGEAKFEAFAVEELKKNPFYVNASYVSLSNSIVDIQNTISKHKLGLSRNLRWIAEKDFSNNVDYIEKGFLDVFGVPYVPSGLTKSRDGGEINPPAEKRKLSIDEQYDLLNRIEDIKFG